MRLFYLINEPVEGYQVGYRDAINSLRTENVIDDCFYFPFEVREKELGSWSQTLSLLFSQIKEFQPSAILVAHLGDKHDISRVFVDQIRNVTSTQPVLAYDERDVYGWIRKPLPSSVLNFANQCDVAFLVAGGRFAKRFKDAGCANIVFLPHVADTVHFGRPWTPTSERKFDVVMIANSLRSRLPFMSMPGVREREELARRLFKSFKNRFGLYGNNWNGYGGDQGHVSFFEQERVLRTSWMSIGLDHFPTFPLYFSDRLPIALISGVAHLTNYTPGLETLFRNGKDLKWFHTVEEAVYLCEEMMNGAKEELLALGLQGQSLAKECYTEKSRMARIIQTIKGIGNQRQSETKGPNYDAKSVKSFTGQN